MRRAAALLVWLALCAPAAWSAEARPAAEDPVLEKRVMQVSEELRCLVCQNQSLADSHADLAVDLRNQVREKLKEGMSEREIADYMVARYGDFVLYRPPVKATTLMLWFGPFALLAIGLLVLYRRLATRRPAAPAELSAADRERAAALLGADENSRPR